jgi:mono/diheme cytochrome c family protein
VFAAIVGVVGVVLRGQAARRSGQDVYTAYCASCHDHPGERIPAREALAKMSPARILRTLDFGLMMSIAYLLP